MMMRVVAVFIPIASVLLSVWGPVCGGEAWNDEERLVGDLLGSGRYDAAIRPARNVSRPTEVRVQTQVFGILGLDSRTQEMSTVSSYIVAWQDDRLRWNPANYSGLEVLAVRANKVWHPSLIVLNALNEARIVTDDAAVLVSSDGAVYVARSLVQTTLCSLDLEPFPFDRHTCSLFLGAGDSVPGDVLRLTASEAEVPRERFQAASIWRLEGFTIDVTDSPNCLALSGRDASGCLRGSQAAVYLTLAREPKYYIYSVLVPCTLLTLMASAAFWLPADCGERLSFGTSVLFGLVVFLLIVQESLVEAGRGRPPMLVRAVLMDFVLIGVTVIESVVSMGLHRRGDGRGHDLPEAVRPADRASPPDGDADPTREDVSQRKKKARESRDWQNIARILDRASFALYYLVYITVNLTMVVEILNAQA